MRSVFAVAAREIRELRLALAGAAIIGLLPLVPLFWPAGPHPVDVEAALLAELIACALLAAVTGATIIGGDLADRKLGFYFARPIPGWSIWAGKVAGGAGVVAAGSILALLPGVLAARGAASGLFTRSAWPAPRDILLILAALYFVTIGLGIVLRSRSGFAAFDALAFAAAALVSATILRNLVLGGVVEDSRSAAEIAAALFGGAVLSASAAGIAAGRVDRRRVHAIFSTVLWSLTAIAIAAAGGLELWIRSASPASIETAFSVTAAPKGPWIEVAGRTGNRFGYKAEFLIDPESGRFLRLGGGLLAAESLAYSADGRRAAWWEAESGGQYSGAHLAVLDLAAPGNRPRQTKIARPDRWGGRLVLDRDGTRVAMLNDEQISIYEIASDRLLLSVRIPGRGVDIVRAFFRGDSTFRYVTHPGAISSGTPEKFLEVMDVDLAVRRVARRGSWPVSSKLPLVLISPSLDRLLVTGAQEQSIRLVDIDSGSELARIPDHPGLHRQSARFLEDGKFALLDMAGRSVRLRIFSDVGVELPAIPLGKSNNAVLGGESAPGILIASLGDSPTDMHAVSIDVSRALTRPLGDHLIPAAAPAPAMTLDPEGLPRAGSPAIRLFFTPSGGLVSVDPATGARKVILSGRAG